MAGLLFPPKSAAAKATAASVPVCPAAAFSVERIEDPAQLAGLEPVWNRLLDESDVLHPFVTHEWVQTWWECYAGLARLSVLVAREGNTVRAIAPLMRARQSMLGLPVDCTLAARNDHSPRFDLIVAGRAAEAYRALWSTMAPSAGLKALEIGDVPADSATVAALVTMARRDGLLCGLRTTA